MIWSSEIENLNQVFIIAEAGVNHNGSLDVARKLVDAAFKAGADAVKFQTYKTEKFISRIAPKAEYQRETTDDSESQFEMLKKLELGEETFGALNQYCVEKGIQFLSTPFDLESLDFLVNRLNVSRIKLSSGEVTNAPLLLRAAQTDKPIILSTGMSTLDEVKTALSVLAFGYTRSDEKPSVKGFSEAYSAPGGRDALKEKVILLHCTTRYPAPFHEINLRVMNTLRQIFSLPVGYSDHSKGISVTLAAVALGAVVIEKHFTLDKALPGPDHKMSLEPDELKMVVASIREVEQALGSDQKNPSSSELKNRKIVRRSIFASQDIRKGEIFTERNIAVKRPEAGISPIYYWDMIGKTAERDYSTDEVIE